ncbi:5940_t:CDS:2, partial [Gigaspora margarita]
MGYRGGLSSNNSMANMPSDQISTLRSFNASGAIQYKVPTLTTATQLSTKPLPEPILTSKGFFVFP